MTEVARVKTPPSYEQKLAVSTEGPQRRFNQFAIGS